MTLDTPLHRNILLRILKDIYTDMSLAPFLGFKGGTAVYIFYNLPRFSVDLDFDLLNGTQKENVFEKIYSILQEYGQIKDARQKRFSIFFLLSYHEKHENAYNIKVEINTRIFGSRYEVKSYLGIAMKVMVQADMAAHKMVAMLERLGKTNRDIFDVYFLLKNSWPINYEIIQNRTNMSFEQFLQICIDRLEQMSDRHILSGLGELLDAKQKAWVKKNLRTETIFLLKLQLDNFMVNKKS